MDQITCEIEVVAAGRTYRFAGDDPVVIGRSPEASVSIEDLSVGRRHARLLCRDGDWVLVDEASRNGTWVQGQRVSEVIVDRPVTARLGGPQSNAVIHLRLVGPTPDRTESPNRSVPAAAGTDAAAAQTAVLAPTSVLDPAGRVDHPAPPQPSSRQQVDGPVLVVRIGTTQKLFPVGQVIRVGRDASLDLVTENPLVTRHQHGVISSDAEGATYQDTSSRGTFLNGRRLNGPLRITESVVLRLGDPATGEELGITPPLSARRIATNQRSRALRRYAIRAGVAAVAAAALVVGLVVALVPGHSSGLSPAALNRAVSSTVRLLMGSPSDYSGWGSGTIISPHGLILTNGHVADPQAPGEAVALGAPGASLDPSPPYLTVEMTDGESRPVVARYRARTVAVDGYLDLAAVQIYATAAGAPVDASRLQLPWLPVGNVSQLSLDQAVTVLGFPGVSGSDSITVTSGVISTFVPDPLSHVNDPRFELETTARVAHGNSGGAAIDDRGQLIGVPSLTIPGEGSDISWRLRSVSEAASLIAAAESGRPYSSRILTPLSGQEDVLGIGIGATAQEACSGMTNLQFSGTATAATVAFDYRNFPVGVDVALEIQLPDGTLLQDEEGSLPQLVVDQASGCASYILDPSSMGLARLPSGRYLLQVLAGPSLRPVGSAASVTVEGS